MKNDSGNPLNVARSASGLGQVADRSTSSDRGKQAQTANLAAPLQDPAPAAAPTRGKQRFEDWMVFLPLFMFDSIVDDLTASWPDWAYYGAQAGTVLVGPGKWRQVVRAGGKEGGLVIGKMDDLGKATGWRTGDYTLNLPKLPPGPGSWARNSSVLRQEMSLGQPIRDATVDASGRLINNTGFLRAERNLLETHGWTYNPATTLWSPPVP